MTKPTKWSMHPVKTQHPPSLINVFAVRSKDSQGPKVSSCRQQRLIRLGGFETLLGAHDILLGLS